MELTIKENIVLEEKVYSAVLDGGLRSMFCPGRVIIKSTPFFPLISDP